MDQSSFLNKLYINSLTPFEILDACKKNDYTFETEKQQHLNLKLWKESVSKESSKIKFLEYCDFYNLSESDISLMTSSRINFNEQIDYPFWVTTLQEILDTIDFDNLSCNHENQNKPFYHLFMPFFDYFVSKFKQRLTEQNIALPSQKIINQLETNLYTDLFRMSRSVLLTEFSDFQKEERKISSNNNAKDFYYKKYVSKIITNRFECIFLNYPVLGRKITSTTHRYIEFAAKLFERFSADKSEIEYCFETKLSKISHLHLSSGDQHNGESTVIIEFNNDYKIVYKPSNSKITIAYNQFLEWINSSLGENLRSFTVVNKESHSWLEFVKQIQCDKKNDIELYYERAGILLGITYFLNSRDYHFENVIASGNCPVLIDHETLIGPNYKLSKRNDVGKSDSTILIGTILESLLLSSRDPDTPPYISGFGSSVQLEENTLKSKYENPNTDSMRKVRVMVSNNLYKCNKPILNGKIEKLVDYQAQFKKGFNRFYNLILENKQVLLAENSPLNCFKDLNVRYVHRTTLLYYKILKFLNQPKYLSDATAYGFKLEILARAYTSIGNLSPILESERNQMLLGDIPVFYLNSLADGLSFSNGKSIDIFKYNTMDSIYDKISKASQIDYSHQMDIMQDVIAL